MGEGDGFQSCGISEWAVCCPLERQEPNDHLIPIPARQENRIPTGKFCEMQIET